MLHPATQPPNLLRAAVTTQQLDLGREIAFAYVASIGTPDEWSIPTLAMRIAGGMKIIADRAADEREAEVRTELAPKCGACEMPVECDDFDGGAFCSSGCRHQHYEDIATDRAIDEAKDLRAERLAESEVAA